MLSLVLIVKNEEKNLGRCLDSAVGLWDELVIVDTGSTDKTVEIAKRYTDKVCHFTWVKHFAKARNFSFSQCSMPWVMWLDADDALKPEDVKIIREEFLKASQMSHIDYILLNYHYWVEPPALMGTPKATQLRERIIRKEKAKWVGRCHEHITVDWNRSYTIPNAAVWHLRDNEDRQADSNRNLELMKLEAEETPSQRNYFYLGNEYVGIGDHKEALKCYRKSYELNENYDTNFQAAYKIAESSQVLDKKEDAITWYLKAIQHNPAYREPLLGLSSIYMEMKDYPKVVFWLEAALQISEPANPVMVILKENYTWVPYNNLSQAYFQLKNYKKAIEISEKLYEAVRQPGILNDISISKAMLKATYKRPTGATRLNLGSGGKTIPGFVNCDLFPQPGVDEVFSLEEIPYADKSVDEISSEHSLEHLPRLMGEKAIREWGRVLKQGGRLNLKVPDLEECCRMFLERPQHQDAWYMHTLYGVQDFRDSKDAAFKDKVNYGQIHYTGFTEKRLKNLLTEAGFIIDKMYKYDGWDTPSLAVEAHIPALNDGEIKKIAFINNTLVPKYLSYGDYWEDAFRVRGHQVDIFHYENVNSLPIGYDLYFFIEAGGRYNCSAIPDVSPKVLYTQENPDEKELQFFDIIATPNSEKMIKWTESGLNVICVPNSNQVEQIDGLLNLKVSTLKKKSPISTKSRKVVDIIIPSYKNVEYLQLTIKSVKKNTQDYQLIVVNSGDDKATRSYLKSETGITLIDSKERLSFSQAVNVGLKASTNDVVILNNDTLVGKNWLEEFRNSPFDITNPFSNCDAGWIHNQITRSITIGGLRLQPNMAKEDVDFEKITDMESPDRNILARNTPGQSWVAFYATYIKRRVINETGYLDETFINGGEDYDYCRRAVKLGFTCGHVFSSWVFHFGGKTRKVSENDNFEQHHSEDKFNNDHMRFKDRPTVVIHCGRAWEPWNVNNINTTGIGGSETCAALLAKALVTKGYRSVVIGDCEKLEGTYDGVEYLHYTKFDNFKEHNYVDYFISSRAVSPLSNRIRNGKNYVWSHDIFIPECANSPLVYTDRVTKFICLSPWHVEFFSQHHGVSPSKIYVQGNGLDLSRYENAARIEKDPYRLIYSSSPDRGLLTLLQMYPGIKEKFPKLNLHIFYGFDNWEKAIKMRGDPREIEHLNSIKKLMKQEGVFYHGRVSQKQLAVEQMKSALWVYPTQFTETNCISSMEAMLAGAVPICTTVAALRTTVPDDCGVKVGSPWDCSNAVISLLQNPDRLQGYRDRGRLHVLKNWGWDKVAENWVEMFKNT